MKKTKNYSEVLWFILFGVSIVGAVISGKVTDIHYIDLLKPYLILILVLGIIGAIIREKYPDIMENRASLLILCTGYILSVAVISFFPFLPVDNLWMIGGILIARLVHPFIGLAFQLIFNYLFCTLNQCSLEIFICYLLIGTVMCLLVKYMTKWNTFFYVAIISLSAHIIILLLMNNFILEQAMSLGNLYSICCDGLMLLAVYLLPDGQKKPILVPEEETVIEDLQSVEKEKEIISYEQYVSMDAELMKRLSESLPAVYRHSLLVSILSEKAARHIKCNASLAKAGGMYHEIGKLALRNLSEENISSSNPSIARGDYIEEGIRLAKEHNLPQEIIDIIREHNGKNGAPKSKESVIVMLTENIIGTIKYFEKEKEKKVPEHDKIIDNIFEVRLGQGILDETGLSLLEYKLLKEFYHTNIPKGNKAGREQG